MKRATIFAIAVCLVGWAMALLFGELSGGVSPQSYTIFGSLYMFLPAVVALVIQLLSHRKGQGKVLSPTQLQLLRFRPRWSWLVGVMVAVVAVFLSLGVSALFVDVVSFKEGTMAQMVASGASPELIEQSMAQLNMVPDWAMLLATVVSGLLAGVTINALFAFGEEFGWRCFLVGELADKKFLPSALFIGAVWGIWHAPMILLYGHNYPNDRALGVAMMVLFCVLVGAIELYFVLKAGSVWPAAIFHGVMNALGGVTVIMIPNESNIVHSFMGLSGAAALSVVCLALYLWDRYVSRDNIFGSTLGASLSRADKK